MAKKASLSQLTTNTHKGRPSRSSRPPISPMMNPSGVKGSQMKGADPRLTAAALTSISPTPSGPEPHWPAGV